MSKSQQDAVISEKIELALQLEKSRQSVNDLSSQIVASEKVNNDLQQERNHITIERDSLSVALTEIKSALIDTEAELDSLQSEQLQLKSKLTQTRSELEALREAHQHRETLLLQEEVSALNSTHASLLQQPLAGINRGELTVHSEEDVAQLLVERDSLRGELGTVRGQLQSLSELPDTNSHLDALNNLSSELDEVRKSRDSLTALLESSEARSRENVEAVERLQVENERLITQLARSHDAGDVDSKLAKLQQELEVRL